MAAAGRGGGGRWAAMQGLLLQRGCGGAFHRARGAVGEARLQAALQRLGEPLLLQLLHPQRSFVELAAAPLDPALMPPAELQAWQQGKQWRLHPQWPFLRQLLLQCLVVVLLLLYLLLPPLLQSCSPPYLKTLFRQLLHWLQLQVRRAWRVLECPSTASGMRQ